MRLFVYAALLTAVGGCSQPPQEADAKLEQSVRRLDYSVAYEATEGGFKGMSMFVDPASGETWAAFRDERDALAKEGPGDPLSPCTQRPVGCFQTTGGQALLSDLPPAGFLNGAFRYSAQPRQYWSMPCNEISAVSDRGTTTSVVCPSVGLVEFSFVVSGSDSPLERYQLKSMNGLFAER
ncbi:hypothetical protein D3C85_1399340 [compost metagenome]